MSSARNSYDVVVVGGGHNGLVAAAYLARAGLSTLVLERLPLTGGAGLVTPLPAAVVADLGLDLPTGSQPVASYAPTLRDGRAGGLLAELPPGARSEQSFRELTGGDEEYAAWREFHADVADLAHVVAPTLLRPLALERDIRAAVDPGLWRDFVTTPLGVTIESRFADDTVRGLVAADALVGTFTSLHDESLEQNRCLLYRLIGAGAPVPGAADALARAATDAGAEILTSAGVSSIRGGDDGAEVTWHDGMSQHTVAARFVLSNVAPWVLRILLGETEDPDTKPEGAQLRISLLLDRLPQLGSGLDPEVAFAGTVLLDHGYTQLQAAYDDAAAGRVPSVLPGRVRRDGPTLSYVGLHTPARLFDADPGAKDLAVARALESLDRYLAEPIADRLVRVEAKTPQDVEHDLAMPGGHPFHGDLDWPWAPNRARLDTPAQQWGVQTDVGSVLVCGAGSRRGGGIAGLGGHSAAHAVLASR